MRKIKMIILMLAFVIVPMLARIIGIGLLSKFTDDFALLYSSTYQQYGLNSNELKLVTNYGGTFFSWIGYLLLFLVIYRDKAYKKVNSNILNYIFMGITLSSVIVLITNPSSEMQEFNIIWIICYCFDCISMILLEEYLFRYKLPSYIDNKYLRLLIPLIFYIFIQTTYTEMIIGSILYIICYFIYIKTKNLSYSLGLNLSLSVTMLILGIVNNKCITVGLVLIGLGGLLWRVLSRHILRGV